MWTAIRLASIVLTLIVFGSTSLFLSQHADLWVQTSVAQTHVQRLSWVISALESIPGSSSSTVLAETVLDHVGAQTPRPFRLRGISTSNPSSTSAVLGCPSDSTCTPSSDLLTAALTSTSRFLFHQVEENDNMVAIAVSQSLGLAVELQIDAANYFAVQTASWGSVITSAGFICCTIFLWQLCLVLISSVPVKFFRITFVLVAICGTLALFLTMFEATRVVNDRLLQEALGADNEASCQLIDAVVSYTPQHLDDDYYLRRLSRNLDLLNSQTSVETNGLELPSVQTIYLSSLSTNTVQTLPDEVVEDLEQASTVAKTFRHEDTHTLNTVMISAELGDGTSFAVHSASLPLGFANTSAARNYLIVGVVATLLFCAALSACVFLAIAREENNQEPTQRSDSAHSSLVALFMALGVLLLIMGCCGIPFVSIVQHAGAFTQGHQEGLDAASSLADRQVDISDALLSLGASLLSRTEVTEAQTANLLRQGESPLDSDALNAASSFYTSVQTTRGTLSATQDDIYSLFSTEYKTSTAPRLTTSITMSSLEGIRDAGNVSSASIDQLAGAIFEMELHFLRFVAHGNRTLFETREAELRLFIEGNLTSLSATVPVATDAISTQLTSFIAPGYTNLAAAVAAAQTSAVSVEDLYQTDTAHSVEASEYETQSNFTDLLGRALAMTNSRLGPSYVEMLQDVTNTAGMWGYISIAVVFIFCSVWVVALEVQSAWLTPNCHQEARETSKRILLVTVTGSLLIVASLIGAQFGATGALDSYKEISQSELSYRRALLIKKTKIRCTETIRYFTGSAISHDPLLGSAAIVALYNLTTEVNSLRSLLDLEQLSNVSLLSYELDGFIDEVAKVAGNWTEGMTTSYYPPARLASEIEEGLSAQLSELEACATVGGVAATGNFSLHWAEAVREALGAISVTSEAKTNLEAHLASVVSSCGGSATVPHLANGLSLLDRVLLLREESDTFVDLTATMVDGLYSFYKERIEVLLERTLEQVVKEEKVEVENRYARVTFWVPILSTWCIAFFLKLFVVKPSQRIVELGTLREGRKN